MPDAGRSRIKVIGAGVALLTVVVGVTWMLTGPDRPDPVYVAPTQKPFTRPVEAPPPLAPSISAPARVVDTMAIDPEVQRMADDLAAKTEAPSRDLEIVGDFIELYRKVFQQGNPIGLNEDITATLTGHNSRNGILFPPGSPMIVKGQLVDRWGTPYWFHPNTGFQMEIRSAGPDRELFTPDDVVMNPGPDTMGIGGGAAASPQS